MTDFQFIPSTVALAPAIFSKVDIPLQYYFRARASTQKPSASGADPIVVDFSVLSMHPVY